MTSSVLDTGWCIIPIQASTAHTRGKVRTPKTIVIAYAESGSASRHAHTRHGRLERDAPAVRQTNHVSIQCVTRAT